MLTSESPNETLNPSAADKAKQAASGIAQKAKATAGSVAQDVASTASNKADAAKTSVADEMSGVASALRTAAEDMRSGSPQERTFGQIAEGIADASEAMRNKDLSTMVQDVSGFARRNPLVFLGGAVLVGFAATRFSKSSSDTMAAHPGTPYTPTHGDS